MGLPTRPLNQARRVSDPAETADRRSPSADFCDNVRFSEGGVGRPAAHAPQLRLGNPTPCARASRKELAFRPPRRGQLVHGALVQPCLAGSPEFDPQWVEAVAGPMRRARYRAILELPGEIGDALFELRGSPVFGFGARPRRRSGSLAAGRPSSHRPRRPRRTRQSLPREPVRPTRPNKSRARARGFSANCRPLVLCVFV